jgi:hypothetical protein
MQLTLADIKRRIDRLHRLARGLAREVEMQRGAEDVLLFRERKQYLAVVQDAPGRGRRGAGAAGRGGESSGPAPASPASSSERSVLRQAPEVRAVCGSAARTDPRGGLGATPVPTATPQPRKDLRRGTWYL